MTMNNQPIHKLRFSCAHPDTWTIELKTIAKPFDLVSASVQNKQITQDCLFKAGMNPGFWWILDGLYLKKY